MREVFTRCGGHVLPATPHAPPGAWAADFAALAKQTESRDVSLDEGFARLVAFWEERGLAELAGEQA